jgi:hypothetical protein
MRGDAELYFSVFPVPGGHVGVLGAGCDPSRGCTSRSSAGGWPSLAEFFAGGAKAVGAPASSFLLAIRGVLIAVSEQQPIGRPLPDVTLLRVHA